MRCTQCNSEAVEAAKFCANCGAQFSERALEHPEIKSAKSDTAAENRALIAVGCGALLFILTVGLIATAINWVSSIGEPSAEELNAETAQYEQEASQDAARQEAFTRQQQPLWSSTSDALTTDTVFSEIAKCKQDIERDGSPYAWMYDEVDPKDAVESVRSGRPILLTAEHRLDGIGGRSVEWAQYNCWFKGAGYERVEKDPNVHYTNNYLPDL